MIRTTDGFRKVCIAGWIAINIPVVVVGFIAGLLPGLSALAIGIGGIILCNRAFTRKGN